MMNHGKITTQGMGMNVEQTVNMFGGASNMNVGASFAQLINCTPKFDPTQDKPKVWQTEAGVYGLPSKVSVKMAPTTLGKELVEALQVFGNEACCKAAQGLAGQSKTQFPGLRGLMQQSIVWTIELEKISFEGDELPMEVCVSDMLKDGEEFQASGKLNQCVNMAQQHNLAGLGGLAPKMKSLPEASAAVDQANHGTSKGCCTIW